MISKKKCKILKKKLISIGLLLVHLANMALKNTYLRNEISASL